MFRFDSIHIIRLAVIVSAISEQLIKRSEIKDATGKSIVIPKKILRKLRVILQEAVYLIRMGFTWSMSGTNVCPFGQRH